MQRKTKKLPAVASNFEFLGSKAVLVFLSAPLFCIALTRLIIPISSIRIWYILLLCIAGTLPALLFNKLFSKVGFGYSGLDIDLPEPLRRVKSYFNSNERNIALLKGTLFHIISPWILMPLLALFYDFLPKFLIIKGEPLDGILVAIIGWNFSCYVAVGYYDCRTIVKKWWYIQDRYPPWPEGLTEFDKKKLAEKGEKPHDISAQEEALAGIVYSQGKITNKQLLRYAMFWGGWIIIFLSLLNVGINVFRGKYIYALLGVGIAGIGFLIIYISGKIGKKKKRKKG